MSFSARRPDLAGPADVDGFPSPLAMHGPHSDEQALAALGESTIAYEIACRFFPRFALLPGPLVDAIRCWAPLFEPGGVLLSIWDRETIARAVSRQRPLAGQEPARREAAQAGGGQVEQLATARRDSTLGWFARKVTSSAASVERADIDRLLAPGLGADEIREVAVIAPVYRFIAHLTAAPCLGVARGTVGRPVAMPQDVGRGMVFPRRERSLSAAPARQPATR